MKIGEIYSIMARRKNRPTDPAEAARKRREQEAKTRSLPALWGVNEQAIAAQADVVSIAETRTKARRVFRFDCFATLKIAEGDLAAVRRFEDILAVRYRVDGNDQSAGRVDSGGAAELVTARSIAAGEQIDALIDWMEKPWHAPLLLALLMPQVTEGKRVNWHGVVKNRVGLNDRDMQAKAVKQAANALVSPFARWDDGERPERVRVAA